MATERFDTVIVGGGQAGLATGYHLQQRGRSFVILDASERVGDPWRKRWDSLGSTRRRATTGSPGCASRASAPITRRRTRWRTTSSRTRALRAARSLEHERGRTDEGRRPLRSLGGRCDVRGRQRRRRDGRHAESVRPELRARARPADHTAPLERLPETRRSCKDGAVLVVGASHSGADIAYELAAEHDTMLSGADRGQIPVRVDTRRGRMGFRVLAFAGKHIFTMDTPMGRRCALTSGTRARRSCGTGGRTCSPRASSGRSRGRSAFEMAGRYSTTAASSTSGTSSGAPASRGTSRGSTCRSTSDDGYPVQYRGVVESAPGLYFVGLLFLHSFTSMLIYGSGRDAGRVARHIASQTASSRASTRAVTPVAERVDREGEAEGRRDEPGAGRRRLAPRLERPRHAGAASRRGWTPEAKPSRPVAATRRGRRC